MSNPWDPPAPAAQGDLDEDHLYMAIGKAVSHWELVEVKLSILLGYFLGKPLELDPIRVYGDGAVFTRRAAIVEDAAYKFFVRAPSQSNEHRFDTLMSALKGWSGRRNDVAHGTVMQTSRLSGYRQAFIIEGRMRYVLVPSFYMTKKRDQHHEPTYVYSSLEIEDFTAHFTNMVVAINDFGSSIFPDYES